LSSGRLAEPGIGKFLFKHLIDIARRNGIAGFTAEVLRDNRRMQHIFNHSGFKVQSRIEEGSTATLSTSNPVME